MASFYGSRWRKLRAAFLTQNPLCEPCRQLGRVTEATVAHHAEGGHKGDFEKFWTLPLTAMCAPCHNRLGALEDAGRQLPGCDERGVPLGNPEWRKAYAQS